MNEYERPVRQEQILVVDDEPSNLKLLDYMLRGEGYTRVELVRDPREVLEHYRSGRPDVILLDLNMPHLDGFQVLAQLQALEDPLSPPVLVLTAQHGREDLLRALEAGARDYVTKPFDRNELLMRVRNLLDAQRAHRLLHDQKSMLEEMVHARTQELENTRKQIVRRLGRASEYRDEETGNHILRMSHICEVLARASGWDEVACEQILLASPMHDLGKIGIPDAILLKPGHLDPEEWAVMQTHAEIGARLLEGDDSDLLRMAHEIALTHHEKWDGSGYPNGLAGDAIPHAGRIAALADVFDALTSERPYKKAWTVDEALELIRANRDVHFDPALVDIFLEQLPAILDIRERFAEPPGTAS
ncbi:MAG: HD-GYP domain-containing protein [Pseudomonadota bacterium]